MVTVVFIQTPNGALATRRRDRDTAGDHRLRGLQDYGVPDGLGPERPDHSTRHRPDSGRCHRGGDRRRLHGRAGAVGAAGYAAPRTPWGDPDLQGIWPGTDMVGVPMQRPTELGHARDADRRGFNARAGPACAAGGAGQRGFDRAAAGGRGGGDGTGPAAPLARARPAAAASVAHRRPAERPHAADDAGRREARRPHRAQARAARGRRRFVHGPQLSTTAASRAACSARSCR